MRRQGFLKGRMGVWLGMLLLVPAAWAAESEKSTYGLQTWDTLKGGPLSAQAVKQTQEDRMPADQIAGEIFGVPVSKGNYYFAKRVALIFPSPWGASDRPAEKLEDFIWDQLILHFESTRRNVSVSPEEEDQLIGQILRGENISWTPQSDPQAFEKWVREKLQEEPQIFRNQIQYLLAIKKLKDQVLEEAHPTAGEEEMEQEFLNEKNHVGGEMVTFKTLEEARAFYEKFKEPKEWEKMKASGQEQVRPVSLMTLEAYMDLWSIPKPQMVVFHALEIGSIGEPMPFGRDWCVYRLLEKRTGDLKDFPKERESYLRQVQMKKKYDAQREWLARLKGSAGLKVTITQENP